MASLHRRIHPMIARTPGESRSPMIASQGSTSPCSTVQTAGLGRVLGCHSCMIRSIRRFTADALKGSSCAICASCSPDAMSRMRLLPCTARPSLICCVRPSDATVHRTHAAMFPRRCARVWTTRARSSTWTCSSLTPARRWSTPLRPPPSLSPRHRGRRYRRLSHAGSEVAGPGSPRRDRSCWYPLGADGPSALSARPAAPRRARAIGAAGQTRATALPTIVRC